MWHSRKTTQSSLLLTKHNPLHKSNPLIRSRTWQQPVTMTTEKMEKTGRKNPICSEVLNFIRRYNNNSLIFYFFQGESKKNEDDFFLSGPKINISSLRNQLNDRTANESNFSTHLDRVHFKTWKDNCLLKGVVCLAITLIIIIILVVFIHNNIF